MSLGNLCELQENITLVLVSQGDFSARLIIRELTNNLQVCVDVVLVSTYWSMQGVTDGMILATEAFYTE